MSTLNKVDHARRKNHLRTARWFQVLTPTSKVPTIDALCKLGFEDSPRSSLLLDTSKAVQALRAKPTYGTGEDRDSVAR